MRIRRGRRGASQRRAWLLATLALLVAAQPVWAGGLLSAVEPQSSVQTQSVASAAVAPTEPVRFVPASSAGFGPAMTEHELAIECPPADPTVVFRPDRDTIVERTGCPFRIIDGADLLGSPTLAMDPFDPNRMAFFSLHGCATDEGPNPWSRIGGSCAPGSSGTTHTTFTSENEGLEWDDQPHGNQGFGEQAHGVIDRDGRIYIAHLISKRLGDLDGEPVYKYHMNLYKEQDWDLNYYSRDIPTRQDGNTIEHVNLALVTPWTRVETLEQYNQTQNETAAASTDDQVGNATIEHEQEDFDDDLVMAVWHERALDHTTTDTGKSSWVGAAWTDTSSRNEWQLLGKDQLIGPCRQASNGEAWNGRVYVACSVDAGYDGRRGARIGDVDIWAIDPSLNDGDGGKVFIAQANRVRDGVLTMAMNSYGMMALASLKPLGDEAPYNSVQVDLAFAWHGRHWTQVNSIGHTLHQAWNIDFREARITGMEVLDEPNRPTLYLSYLERSMETTTGDADPDNPLGISQGALEYHKLVSTWEPCEPVVAMHDLQVGVVRHPFEQGVVDGFTGAFDDYRDGLTQAIDPNGIRHIYFAWGDHGVIQYGKILAESGSGSCPVPNAPPLFVAPPPIPVALTGATGVNIGMAAMLGAPATAMIGYLLVAKRRVAIAAVTKAK